VTIAIIIKGHNLMFYTLNRVSVLWTLSQLQKLRGFSILLSVFWCMLQLKEWADRFPKGASRHGTSALKKTGVHVMYLDCTFKL
jgi:hypothetical protein